MANIKSIADITYNGWELTYEVDWKTGGHDSSGNMSDEGTIAVNGVTWNALITNGTLEVKPNTGILITPLGSSDWYAGGRQCPILYCDIKDMVPNLSAQDIICIQWIMDYPDGIPANNYEGGGMNLWDGVGGGSWKGMGAGVVYNSNQKWRGVKGPNAEGLIADANEFNTFEIVYYMTGQCGVISGAATGVKAFSQPLTMTSKRQFCNQSEQAWTTTEASAGITTPITKASGKCAFYAIEVNATRTFRVNIEEMRVFRCRTHS
jgi:hypothetical protein